MAQHARIVEKAAIFCLPWKKFCPIEQRSSCGTVLGDADENDIRNVAGLIRLFSRHEYSIFKYIFVAVPDVKIGFNMQKFSLF